jgi:hypothetical protein
MIVEEIEEASSKSLDEDVTISYAKNGAITRISVNNALTRIFEGLAVKMRSERQVTPEEREGD